MTDAVHAATMAALIEGGLDGLVIEEIAARAGVNKTTIYRRWGTREALVAAALTANSGSQIALPDTGSLQGDLVALALQVRDAITAPASRALMTAMAGGHHHDELRTITQGFWASRFAATRPILDRAIARGEVPSEIDFDALLTRLVGPIWFSVFGPGRDPDDVFVRECVDIVLAGTRRHR